MIKSGLFELPYIRNVVRRMDDRFILHNVKHVDGEEIDIVIEDGRIVGITPVGQGIQTPSQPDNGVTASDRLGVPSPSLSVDGITVYDGQGDYVSSGWIDMHVHAFLEFDPYGDEIDEIGVKQGVTTIVDAGSCGADRIVDLARSSQEAMTNLFAFLNISRIGLKRVDELSNLEWIDRGKVLASVDTLCDVIVGLKARISSSVVGGNGIKPLQTARRLSSETELPLMVHIGSAPPDITEVIPLLERKDIITHYLNGKKNNLFDEQGQPLQVLVDAIARGVHLDVGHGTASFSFKVAEAAKQFGIAPNTISTDIYRGNRLNGPVYSMANVLSKFLLLGYPLEQIIAAVTTNAADWLGRPDLGRIRIGDAANLTLFSLEQESAILTDSEGEQRTTNQFIKAKGVYTNGTFIKCEVRA